MKNMIERQSIRTKDYRQALKALKDFDAESFYKIQSISTDRQEIHKYITKQVDYPYFFHYKELGFNNCLETMTIKFKLAIRNKLHELSVAPEFYVPIQEKLLNDKIQELIKEPIHKETRQNIIRFYYSYEEIGNYLRVKSRYIPLVVQAKAELYDILISLNYQNLQFTDIKNMVDSTIEHSSLPLKQLTMPQQRGFRQKYDESKIVKKYIQEIKVDWELEQTHFRKNLISIMNEAPHEIDFETFNQITKSFLDNCDLLTFLDSKALNQNQKTFLRNNI